MTFLQSTLAIICVLAISLGQILFKAAGLKLKEVHNWMHPHVILIISAALLIYGLTTLMWIHLLKSVELSKAYIFMVLSFILVPLASYFMYKETLSTAYLVGLSLVILGLVIIIRFG